MCRLGAKFESTEKKKFKFPKRQCCFVLYFVCLFFSYSCSYLSRDHTGVIMSSQQPSGDSGGGHDTPHTPPHAIRRQPRSANLPITPATPYTPTTGSVQRPGLATTTTTTTATAEQPLPQRVWQQQPPGSGRDGLSTSTVSSRFAKHNISSSFLYQTPPSMYRSRRVVDQSADVSRIADITQSPFIPVCTNKQTKPLCDLYLFLFLCMHVV
jgi:hypothetical protein